MSGLSGESMLFELDESNIMDKSHYVYYKINEARHQLNSSKFGELTYESYVHSKIRFFLIFNYF